VSEHLFDQSESYDDMLQMGLDLSGEDKHYFIQGRLGDLRRQLPAAWRPQRILDFGCGGGDTCSALAEVFPGADVVGADVSDPTLHAAAARHSSNRVSFCLASALNDADPFDLCYVNGAFHHIEPPARGPVLATIHRSLAAGGYLALFENNPWNPGARLVMRRIPFDRDARMLRPRTTMGLVQEAGFSEVCTTRSLFYFPRSFARLRSLEPWLSRVPLGAQYYVLARK
jgi:SAM-dependent methyltransferase